MRGILAVAWRLGGVKLTKGRYPRARSVRGNRKRKALVRPFRRSFFQIART